MQFLNHKILKNINKGMLLLFFAHLYLIDKFLCLELLIILLIAVFLP